MTLVEFVSARRVPYTSMLRELNILGQLVISKQLDFDMQVQTQSNWCWAATATSVSHFYWQLSAWTQCLLVNEELAHNDCCNSPVPAACNVPHTLNGPLTRTKNFVSMLNGQASFQQVLDEIHAGRPVCARIGWRDGGGHFVAIYGYSIVAGTQFFDIDDPIRGKSHLTVSDFASNYLGSGTWTHTYFTQTYFEMKLKIVIPTDKILKRIWEIRPLLQLKQDFSLTSNLHAADARGTSLGIAQRVYSLGLNSLLHEQSPVPQPNHMRVYEMDGTTPRSFFDVTETEQPQVLQMSSSNRYLEAFEKGLSQVLAMTGQYDLECELRLFQVPALNFEALWINYAGDAKDFLVPLLPVGPLPQYKAVPLEEALNALREAARPLAQMDETMGA